MAQSLKLVNRTSVFRNLTEMWAEYMRRNSEKVIKTHKCLADIPGPSTVSFLTDIFCKRGLSRLHELQLEGKAKYGPVWKASFGPILTVHVADPSLIEQVLRQEGKHPIRSDLSSWKDYRQYRGHSYGLLTAEGEEWQQLRSILGKHMLKPKEVEAYSDVLNDVVGDLVQKIKYQRRQSPHVVKDIANEFYRFGLEGISSILFESRIGCLETTIPKETEKFIQSINIMFGKTLQTMAMPKFLHKIYPNPWRKFCESWDYMFAFAKGHIDHRMADIAEKLARGEKVEGKYLTYYLAQEKVPMKSVYANVTELLLSGVDTISSTLSWSLYELARHPKIQASLNQEIQDVLEGRDIATAADVAKMPLMKAVVKEVLRLYPVIPGNARVISDKDIQVGEYIIPKKTLITLCHYATSRDEKYFSNPNEFKPERWLKKDESHHPYASIPFGFGKRSCVGRRIAELEVYLALSRILTHFEVRPENPECLVKPMTRTILVPGKEINLQFLER
ncbi:25-hydroxyvitamin D-1 alpha hydroxylase, mitochondrial [Eleutherodactylus coqui]|uniref:25-hydroxyvitamin D-1 alpha hydroxylase, mitochondrial n=1 Tax=Eleutherodactylus coqui TaxID=57060 RepID=UPI003461F4DE